MLIIFTTSLNFFKTNLQMTLLYCTFLQGKKPTKRQIFPLFNPKTRHIKLNSTKA